MMAHHRVAFLIVFVTLVTTAISNPSMPETTITIDPATAKPGPIRHSQLPPALVARIKAFEPVFADVYPIAHEEWIELFRRDVQPEKEVAIWEYMAAAFAQFTTGRNLSREARREAFGLLLFRSGATADATLKQAKLTHLTPQEAQNLVNLYKAPPEPISVEAR